MDIVREMSLVNTNLVTTYNTNIINTFPPNIKKIYKTIAESQSSEYDPEFSSKNTTLIKLIKNNFKISKPLADFISGPYTLTYHTSKKYNKNIYVFGERHGFKNNCDPLNIPNTMSIVEYLKQLFINTNVFIDFYLEEWRFTENITGTFYIDKLRSMAQNCIRQENCEYPLIRAHYFDLRQSSLLFTMYRNISTFKQLPPKQLELINNIMDVWDWEQFYAFINIDLKVKFLEKEILRSDINSKVLYVLFDRILVSNKKYYQQLKNSLKLYVKTRDPKYIPIIGENVVRYGMITDIYLLARMFKTFTNKKNINHPEKPYNIIVYTGDIHARTNRSFLKLLGFQEHYKATHKDLRCLDMANINQPLFTDTN